MNSTLASSGKPAMKSTAWTTLSTAIIGSLMIAPCACNTPAFMRDAVSVSALPMSICPQAMSKARPSSAALFVKPLSACLVAV
jgi:hypothetical protein